MMNKISSTPSLAQAGCTEPSSPSSRWTPIDSAASSPTPKFGHVMRPPKLPYRQRSVTTDDYPSTCCQPPARPHRRGSMVGPAGRNETLPVVPTSLSMRMPRRRASLVKETIPQAVSSPKYPCRRGSIISSGSEQAEDEQCFPPCFITVPTSSLQAIDSRAGNLTQHPKALFSEAEISHIKSISRPPKLPDRQLTVEDEDGDTSPNCSTSSCRTFLGLLPKSA